MAVLERLSLLEIVEELQVNFVDIFRLDAQLKTLKHQGCSKSVYRAVARAVSMR